LPLKSSVVLVEVCACDVLHPVKINARQNKMIPLKMNFVMAFMGERIAPHLIQVKHEKLFLQFAQPDCPFKGFARFQVQIVRVNVQNQRNRAARAFAQIGISRRLQIFLE